VVRKDDVCRDGITHDIISWGWFEWDMGCRRRYFGDGEAVVWDVREGGGGVGCFGVEEWVLWWGSG